MLPVTSIVLPLVLAEKDKPLPALVPSEMVPEMTWFAVAVPDQMVAVPLTITLWGKLAYPFKLRVPEVVASPRVMSPVPCALLVMALPLITTALPCVRVALLRIEVPPV